MASSVTYCPNCDGRIQPSDVNLKEGVALCSGCQSLVQLSDVNFSGQTVEETLSQSHKSISIQSGFDRVRVEISLFSVANFLGALAISVFWNGIVSVFASFALSGLFYNLGGAVPEWLPVLGLDEGKPIMNGEVMGLGMTLGLCLFLTPFLVIGSIMIFTTLMSLAGASEIVLDRRRSYVATGIGPIRVRREFDATAVAAVELTQSKFKQNQEDNTVIEIVSDRKVRFGSYLSKEQRDWCFVFLKAVLIHKRDPNEFEGTRGR